MIDFRDAEKFLDTIFLELMRVGIDVSYYELDHICYRVETLEQYKEYKSFLAEKGDLLSENQIGGRAISTYKLFSPIKYQNREIYVLELPAPKQGRSDVLGFEHVEFVIDDSFDTFMSKSPDVNFDLKAIEKETNPDISISFGNISVKFHKNTLEHVIKFEQ